MTDTYVPAGTELSTDDVESFTNGRLSSSDDRVELLLASALASARTFCGWHVTPERKETVTLDGHGGYKLLLPTMRVVDLISVTEDGVELDVDNVVWAARGVLVKQRTGSTDLVDLRWTQGFQAVTVEMVHGYVDAPDWRYGVLSMVDRMALDGGLDSNLVEKTVADVTYRWAPRLSLLEESLFGRYRLL